MLTNFLFLSNNIEYYYIQIIIFLSIIYLQNTENNLNKLFSFFCIIFWLGILLFFNNYEIMVTFLWLLEFTFILIIGFLYFTYLNYTIEFYKNKIKNYNFFINFGILLFLSITILFIIINYKYLYFYKLNLNYSLNLNCIYYNFNLINYYNFFNANFNISQTTTDLKNIGLKLYNYNFLTLLIFLILLMYISLFIIIIYLNTFLKHNFKNHLNILKYNKNIIKKNLNLNILKNQQLEKQFLKNYYIKNIKNNY